MIMIYFSGTGNSKYIATSFSKKMNIVCHSVEEQVDFKTLIDKNETIGVCFPTYGSRVPRIMREFVAKYSTHLKGKKLVIFCTQLMFSGDGARAFVDLLPKNFATVIYAEHFNMPNNICNAPIFKITNGDENKKYLKVANKKVSRACDDIKNGKVLRRGFNIFSKGLGLIQGKSFPSVELKNRSSVRTSSDCNGCGLCVKLCPMKNLELRDKNVVQKNNCTLCYRCVNACPKKAITTIFHKKPTIQYKGIS